MIKYYLLFIAAVVISSVSQILLKNATKKNYNSVIREYLNPWVISGYALLVLTTVLTVLAYSGLDYKNGPVIESLGYVLIMIFSAVIFKEKITKKKLIGNIIIILGIAVFYL